MENLQVFNNPEFGKIRTVEQDGKVLFCGSDVAKALGYVRPNDAVSRHCRATVKRRTPISGKMQEINFISEGDVYRLIAHSKLPSAERFEQWVFDEVLPAIRKTGSYSMQMEVPSYQIADPIERAKKWIEEEQNRQKLLAENVEMKPKADFFDAVAESKTAISIGDVAKVLGVRGMGRNNLFELLRQKHILMNNNMPYQRFVDAGYFRIVEQKWNKPDGETRVSIKTLVYQKGVDYIRKIVEENINS